MTNNNNLTGKVVCVTGATGYVGSHVAKAALEAGCVVRGTTRNLSKISPSLKTKALLGVEWFEADLLGGPEAFADAFKGCDFILHTAAPFFFECKDFQTELLDPMIKGFDAVWEAAKKAGVKKIVMTSSTATTHGTIVPMNYIEGYSKLEIDEARWNIMSTEASDPYPYAKTMAERHAWGAYFTRDVNTDPELVTLLPGLVMGPPLSKEICTTSTSMNLVVGACMGAFAAVENAPPFKIPPVDVRQVASAHVAALANSEAKGRYILCHDKAWDLADLFGVIDQEYPGNKFPKQVAPIAARLMVDNSKTIKDLFGNQKDALWPMKTTMKDMIEALKGFEAVSI